MKLNVSERREKIDRIKVRIKCIQTPFDELNTTQLLTLLCAGSSLNTRQPMRASLSNMRDRYSSVSEMSIALLLLLAPRPAAAASMW